MPRVWKRLALSSALLAATIYPSFAQSDEPFVPVTDAMLQNPADGDWLMWRRTLDSQGYSPLSQITKENVGDLRMVWSRSMEPGNQESTPLVYNGVMYIPNSRDVIRAHDAKTGDLIWEYRRTLPEDLSKTVSISDVSRSITIYENKIIHVTSDTYIIALNAETGALEWETQINDYKNGNRQTSGPIIVNGKAISSRSCTPFGGADSCFVTAHDLSNGEEVWRTQLIPRPGSPEDETWSGIPYESRAHVGAWMTPSFDPELNMVYFGTSVTSPYAKFVLGPQDLDAEFLYQTSTLAVDADTGEIKWYQQHIRDHWDLDHPFERILVDTQIAPDPSEVRWISDRVEAGKEYKVLTGIPGKTGIFYSIDRETGEFLWARETTRQNTVLDIDNNGRATMNMELVYTELGQSMDVCPGFLGGKDWPAGAYSPLTNAIYYPLQNMCADIVAHLDEPSLTDRGLTPTYKLAPGETNLGTVRGISVETGKELWKWENRSAVTSLVATGGGLLFGGDVDRRFRAFDQETGEVLWETILGGSVGGFPITFETDGKQYVAVATGAFLISGALLGLTPELKPGAGSNMMYVFALPD